MLFHSAGSRELYDSQSPSNEPEEEYSQAAVVYDDPDHDERQRMIAQLQLDNGEEVEAENRLDAEAVVGTEAATDELMATEALSPAASTRSAAGKGKRKLSPMDAAAAAAADESSNGDGARGKRKISPAADRGAGGAGADVDVDAEDDDAGEADEAAAADTPPTKPPAEYRILLSALDAATKQELTNLIRKLGGTILESRTWDVDCTHLVIGSPTRSEKYLAACAAGKWVVRPSFIRKSAESNSFVEEDEHEIRELPSKSKHSNGSDSLGKAPKRWRLILAKDPGRSGAFDGWKVLLCVGNTKLGGFERLLTAGGATIVKDARRATHLFVESGKEKESAGKSMIKSARSMTKAVKVLKADYISTFLQQQVKVNDESKYLVL